MRARLRLNRLVRHSPQGCAHLHGRDFAIAGLPRIRLSHHLVFLGESRIENSAEIHVAGVPARAQNHALPGLDVESLALARYRDSEDPARELFFPNEARHAVPQQYLHAELSHARFEWPHERGAVRARRGVRADLSAPDHGLRPLHGLRSAIGSGRWPVGKLDAVRQQEIERSHALIAEGAHDFPVAETVIMPVGQIVEHAVRRILDAVFLLQTRAAAQSDVAAAFDGVSADVVVLVNHDDRGAQFGGGDGCGKSGGAGAHHHDVGGEVPVPFGAGCLRLSRAEPAEGSRAQAGGRLLNKAPSRQCISCVALAHAFILPWFARYTDCRAGQN